MSRVCNFDNCNWQPDPDSGTSIREQTLTHKKEAHGALNPELEEQLQTGTPVTDFTRLEQRILTALRDEPRTSKQLAQDLNEKRSTIASRITELRKQGYITVKEHAHQDTKYESSVYTVVNSEIQW